MIPASLAVVLADTPPERRAAAIGAWSAAGALAAAAGPALGGVLVDTVGWRALFLINVPVGLAIVYGARVIPGGAPGGRLPGRRRHRAARPRHRRRRARHRAGAGVGLGRPATLGLLAGAVLATAVALRRSFTPRRRRRSRPRSGARARFAAANLASLLYGAALFPWMLIGVLFLIAIWDYSPLEAGLAMTPGAIVAAAVALAAARRTHAAARRGDRRRADRSPPPARCARSRSRRRRASSPSGCRSAC